MRGKQIEIYTTNWHNNRMIAVQSVASISICGRYSHWLPVNKRVMMSAHGMKKKKKKALQHLLKAQIKEDGGFALSGKLGDTDLTGMALLTQEAFKMTVQLILQSNGQKVY